MTSLDPVELVRSIVDLRRAIVEQREPLTRERLREVEARLRRALGPSIAKRKASEALGVSVPALDRWVDEGVLPVVAKPGSSRLEVEAHRLLQVAERIRALRDEGRESRTPVSAAVASLGWARPRGGRRVLALDLAALPRPNVSEDELVETYRTTTPEERVVQVAELSATFGRSAHGEPL